MNYSNLKNNIRNITAVIFAVIIAFAYFALTESVKTARAAEVTSINLADYNSFRWVDGNKASLRDATVYRYRYIYENEWHDYYTTSAMDNAPHGEWEAWDIVSSVVAPCSVSEYKSSGNHSVSVFFTGLRSTDYTVDYSGDYSVSEAGEYVAKATVTLNNPSYKFVYDLNSATNITGRGMSVAIEADGTATVTKIWYVARYENGFLDEAASLKNGEETQYSMPCWTYGSFPSDAISAPRLIHGDEVKGHFDQPDGYSLSVEGFDDPVVEIIDRAIKWNDLWQNGSNDIVTFTLKLNGEIICEDKVRSEFGYYINEYMPAGSYEIIFTAKALSLTEHYSWWSDSIIFGTGGSLEYSGFSRGYFFEIYPAKLSVSIPDEDVYEMQIKDFDNADFASFFSSIVDLSAFSDYSAKNLIEQSGTYWAENTDMFFDETPLVTFSLTGLTDGDYLPADGDWSGYLSSAGRYVVCYRAEMRNYVPDTSGYIFINLVGDGEAEGGGTENTQTQSFGSKGFIAAICVESALIAVLAAATVVLVIKYRKKSN